jgi:hypothetical protein
MAESRNIAPEAFKTAFSKVPIPAGNRNHQPRCRQQGMEFSIGNCSRKIYEEAEYFL